MEEESGRNDLEKKTQVTKQQQQQTKIDENLKEVNNGEISHSKKKNNSVGGQQIQTAVNECLAMCNQFFFFLKKVLFKQVV